jgi:hypothetical protein
MRALTRLVTLCLAGCVVGALATCSIEKAVFTPVSDEDCATEGDEDLNGAADCADPACASRVECMAATCGDGRKNGRESDVDCGGDCMPCGDGGTCGEGRDCGSGLCGGGICVRLASCKEILDRGFSVGNGNYGIDPDGVDGAPAFVVKCDMTTDRGGWTRFNWVTGSYPANADPLGQALSECAVGDLICRGRIPASAAPTYLMVKDLGDGDTALWQFDRENVISNSVLAALRDKTTGCVSQQVLWQPYSYTGTEPFCGTGSEGGCDSFTYVDTTGPVCGPYNGWFLELDGDTGCYSAAFKIGMTHSGYETIGCELPDVNYLDDGPTTVDDATGELYYR